MEFSFFCDAFYWVPLGYPQGDPLGAVPGRPETNYMFNLNNFSSTRPTFATEVKPIQGKSLPNLLYT